MLLSCKSAHFALNRSFISLELKTGSLDKFYTLIVCYLVLVSIMSMVKFPKYSIFLLTFDLVGDPLYFVGLQ